MTDKRNSRKRNLTIMVWMGMACQLAGVTLTFSAVAGFVDKSPIGGALFLIFGMALAGWAGNLLEISDLKNRVAELEKIASHGLAGK